MEEIHLALYLFNNIHLYRELLRLAERGIRVFVTSIPLTGYDRRKIEDATQIYGRICEEDGINLMVFPHMYMWYGALYAGGGAAYSFHIKAGLIKYRNGLSKVFLTSGNLAPGDPTHSESAVFIEAPKSSPYISPFEGFFSEVEQRARPYTSFSQQVEGLDEKFQELFEFSFVGGNQPVGCKASQAFFTAPFINIDGKGSNHAARELIVEMIQSAEKRVLVCAQHVHDLSPFNGYPETTIIGSVLKKKERKPSMDVKVLKQVASSGLADKRRAAFVEGHLYHAGVPQRINRLVHDKFVVVDDSVLLTTSNFTPTQFGWGLRKMTFRTGTNDMNKVKKVVNASCGFFGSPTNKLNPVRMRKRKGKAPEIKVVKKDIFSEVNGFVKIENHELSDKMASYFSTLWKHKLSSDVTIPI